MKPYPPYWPLRFLRWFCREDFIDEIEGDLTEIYHHQYEESPAKARRQFTWNVIKHFRAEFIKSIPLSTPLQYYSHVKKLLQNRPEKLA